jgi:lipid A 3-O-deacylase
MRIKFLKTILFSLLAIFTINHSAKADGGLVLSGGDFNFMQKNPNNRSHSMFQADYNYSQVLWSSPIGDFKPQSGFLTTDKLETMAYAGVRLDWKFFNNTLLISPSFTPGYYAPGDGKRLGYSLEFKSQLRAAVFVTPTFDIGASINHISNAGLGSKNPGANNFSINIEKIF